MFNEMDKGIKLIYDTMDNAIEQLKKTQRKQAVETVSDCCGASPFLESEDLGICPECKEHCAYICEYCEDDAGYYETNIDGADVYCVCNNCNADESKKWK